MHPTLKDGTPTVGPRPTSARGERTVGYFRAAEARIERIRRDNGGKAPRVGKRDNSHVVDPATFVKPARKATRKSEPLSFALTDAQARNLALAERLGVTL